MKKILLIMCMMSMPVLADPIIIYDESVDGDANYAALGELVDGEYVILANDYNDFDAFAFSIAVGSVLESIYYTMIDTQSGDPFGEISSWWLYKNGKLKYNNDPDFIIGEAVELFPDLNEVSANYELLDNSFSGGNYMLTLNVVGIDAVEVPTSVPEPATLGLLAAGLAGLAFRRRKAVRSLV